MVVVEHSLDAEVAVVWALSHAVGHSHRECNVLLQVLEPFSRSSIISSKTSVLYRAGKPGLRDDEVLQSMRAMCKSRRPTSLKIEVVTVKGEKKKLPLMLEEAKRQEKAAAAGYVAGRWPTI
ncbi:hypothetical protein SAY87_003272 [Trapa incisa]|uniref:Uncharacterized protein n=1 Tax=Trapa incisa TaxID=236973 RepID=A0AAN7KJ20_9MYRT|nr:hypothetical protein SAY87_003272 [Trapa incisa]